MDRTLQFLKDLVEADGAPGYEGDVAAVMHRHLKGVGSFSRDRLGSFVCEKKGSSASPRVMLAGHLDEVGFMVKSVTKEGFVRFLPLGGWWGHVVLAQRLVPSAHPALIAVETLIPFGVVYLAGAALLGEKLAWRRSADA